jgi:hypothetical protein
MSEDIFYVYQHHEPRVEQGECVYVGKGCHGRAWDVTRARRDNKHHQQWMLTLCSYGFIPTDWVSIISSGLSEKDALALEKQLIHTLAPKFNMQSGEKQHQAKLTNDDALQIYDLVKSKKHTHKDIADTFGVSRTCVSMIASRKQWKAVLNKFRKESNATTG